MVAKMKARAVLVRDGKLLVMKFDARDGTSFWCTVGGTMEEGETPWEAVQREVFEETGLKGDDLEWRAEPLWAGSHWVTKGKDQTLWNETIYFARVNTDRIDTSGWMEDEKKTIAAMCWRECEDVLSDKTFLVPEESRALIRAAVCSLS